MNADEIILRELERDSRQSNVEIAKRTKVSEGTVRNKISRMAKDGTIKRFTIETGTSKGFTAFVLLENSTGSSSKTIMSELAKIPQVKNAYELAGEHDAVLKVVAESPEAFNSVIDKIRSVDGIEDTKTLTVLKAW